MDFNIGDYVYYSGTNIGKITDKREVEIGTSKYSYRIDYCQNKDIETGPSGGNGPIWVEGYPKRVTEFTDILIIRAFESRDRIKRLESLLRKEQKIFNSLKLVIETQEEET